MIDERMHIALHPCLGAAAIKSGGRLLPQVLRCVVQVQDTLGIGGEVLMQ